MNTPGVILASTLISAAVACGIVLLARPEPPAQATGSETPGRGREHERLAAIEKSLMDLTARLDAAPAEAVRRPEATVDDAKLERMVRAWLDAHRDEVVASGKTGRAADAAGAPKTGTPEMSFDDMLGKLSTRGLSYPERQALWHQAKAAGWMDRLVATFEKRAQANPNSPDVQVELANAYLQQLYTVEDGPAKGAIAMKADAAFDKALEVDERHWEARFNKAVSLSFWPPVLGKQGEAVRHFETLLSQQEESAPRADFAQTYMFLGNLYEQQGKSEKAQEMWKRGLKNFPDNAELKKKAGGK